MKDFKLNTILNNELLQNLFEGICIVDLDKKIRFWNNKAEFITGYTFNEVNNKNYFDVLKHYDRDEKEITTESLPIEVAFKKQIFVAKQALIFSKNHERVSVRIHAIPTFDETDHISGAIEFIVLDSDYLWLMRKNRELTKLSHTKSLFLGMAAHDLKNPLTLIKGLNLFMLNIAEKQLNNELISMIKRINCNCDKMTKLIDYYLNVSNIELGKIELNKVNTNIETLLNLDNYSFTLFANQKNIKLIVNIAPNLPKIELDPDKITQVIENLVNNSIKFSKENTTITLNIEKEEDKLLISIIDNGEGIDQKDLTMIFEPFETATQLISGTKSTGLGLAIVKKIIELHKGTIEVSSIKHKGSVFKIRLPLIAQNHLIKA
ncbi:MAG: ATP-binding protein [Cyanobacteriota bacterium]